MLQFRNIYSRISTKIRKEAFCTRVWGTKMKGKKWTQVLMKWILLMETFNNLRKTLISSFSFFLSCFVLMPG